MFRFLRSSPRRTASRQGPKPGPRTFRPRLERLEQRRLLAVSVTHTGGFTPTEGVHDIEVLRSGVVNIRGDKNANHLIIQRSPAKDMFVVTIEETLVNYVIRDPYRLTKGINFYGYGGDDVYENNTTLVDINIDGGAGNDELYGGFTKSTLSGGADNDTIYLRTNGYVGGSDFQNFANGDAGQDHIYGSIHRDLITGGDGGDYLDAGEGNDFILAGAGGDVLFGGPGVDTLDGGYDAIADLMSGGDESDLYRIHLLPSTSALLDGTPLYDMEQEATIQDGSDRFEFLRHDTQPTRTNIISGFDEFNSAEFLESTGTGGAFTDEMLALLEADATLFPSILEQALTPPEADPLTTEDETEFLVVDDYFSFEDELGEPLVAGDMELEEPQDTLILDTYYEEVPLAPIAPTTNWSRVRWFA